MAVHIAQEVPGGTGPLRHGIGLSLCSSSADRTGGIDPLVNGSQRRFTGTGRLIALLPQADAAEADPPEQARSRTLDSG